MLSIHAFSKPQGKDTGAVSGKYVGDLGDSIRYCQREPYSLVVVVVLLFKLFLTHLFVLPFKFDDNARGHIHPSKLSRTNT